MSTMLNNRGAPRVSLENYRRSQPPLFWSSYPGYRSTVALDRLRATEYPYLDAGGHVYLDYAGAGLPAQAQLSAHIGEEARGRCFGSRHSESSASAASSDLLERARLAVLADFNAPPEEYVAIFTPNATAACRLVGELYPFGPRSRLVLTHDNQNSVHGIREFARSRGAPMGYVPFSSPELRVDDNAIRYALERPAPGRLGAAWRVARSGVAPGAGRGRRARRQQARAWEGVRGGGGPEVAASRPASAHNRGLFAYPAQSHFSGVQHPLRWIEMAHERGFDVLVDAAAYVLSNRLDLSVVKPDSCPSVAKGLRLTPTGVGLLDCGAKELRTPAASIVRRGLALPGQGCRTTGICWGAGSEDGRIGFLQIPDLEFGLPFVADIGIGQIRQRVMCLTGWLIDRLVALRHSNGQPMARIYGPAIPQGRGGTVAFNLLDPSGCVIDERDVAMLPRPSGSRSVPRACATRAPAREFPTSRRLPGGERRGHRPNNGPVPRLSAPAEGGGAPRLSGPSVQRRRRGALPGVPGDDIPGWRRRHCTAGSPAVLLAMTGMSSHGELVGGTVLGSSKSGPFRPSRVTAGNWP